LPSPLPEAAGQIMRHSQWVNLKLESVPKFCTQISIVSPTDC
jgi:hypothetical protein